MKKITLILISIILIATLASCDGSVNSALAASSKTITLQLVDTTNFTYKFEENGTSVGNTISFTTDAETWAELNGTSLGYDITFKHTDSTEEYTYYHLQFETDSGNAMINSFISIMDRASSGSNIASSSTIVDGTTYYVLAEDPS